MREKLLALGLVAASAAAVGLFLERRSLTAERERLESELQSARRRPAPPPPAPPLPPTVAASEVRIEPVPPPPAVPAPARTQEERLAEMTKLLDEMLKADAEGEAPKEKPKPDVRTLQSIALERSRPEKERVVALRALRGEPNGRIPAVVDAMIELLKTSADDRIRTEICRNLKGDTSPGMKAQMLATLRSDPSSRVREEAAESLGPMAADPAVRQALGESSASDPSSEVKEQARRALGERGGDDR